MIILGLTGSIGMGKSTTAGLFARQGIPVFDADRAVRQLYQNDTAVIRAIGARFPKAVRAGKIDRKALIEAVHGEPQALADLERIVHPAVAAARQCWLDAARARGERIVLFDIPLLFETGAQSQVDKVIVVSAPAQMQKERVLARPGMTEAHFERLHAAQMPDQEKRRRADFVIDTSKGLAHAARQVQSILQQLEENRSPSRTQS